MGWSHLSAGYWKTPLSTNSSRLVSTNATRPIDMSDMTVSESN